MTLNCPRNHDYNRNCNNKQGKEIDLVDVASFLANVSSFTQDEDKQDEIAFQS